MYSSPTLFTELSLNTMYVMNHLPVTRDKNWDVKSLVSYLQLCMYNDAEFVLTLLYNPAEICSEDLRNKTDVVMKRGGCFLVDGMKCTVTGEGAFVLSGSIGRVSNGRAVMKLHSVTEMERPRPAVLSYGLPTRYNETPDERRYVPVYSHYEPFVANRNLGGNTMRNTRANSRGHIHMNLDPLVSEVCTAIVQSGPNKGTVCNRRMCPYHTNNRSGKKGR